MEGLIALPELIGCDEGCTLIAMYTRTYVNSKLCTLLNPVPCLFKYLVYILFFFNFEFIFNFKF